VFTQQSRPGPSHRQVFRGLQSGWRIIPGQKYISVKMDTGRYYDDMVSDLKTSNPGKWYSKVKRMSGQSDGKQQNILVDEMIGLDNQQQAECIAEHYSSISNQYQQVQASDFKNI
jgi:hypothetical protein